MTHEKEKALRGRTSALIAASLVSTGLAASAATAAGGPPPPPAGVGGAKIQQVAAGLHTPTSFAFGGGNVFEGDGGAQNANPPNGGVFVLSGGTGKLISGSPAFVAGLAWRKGTLYVSGASITGPHSATWQLLAWSGWNGTTFTKRKAIYTAPKTFAGFNGLAFGPDGRLYVGVDVGLTNGNDHGPAKTPYVYDILSIKPNGHGLKVFATGIRQPWQLAFPSGSSSPLVSDLGQDKGAKNPPDFVLRVHKGDNFGFPSCNWTTPSQCTGFTKPSFAQFAPHTDIMGLAIIGNRLYMTSFLGTGGKGPGGEVFWMPLKGGAAKPLVKGFVAPVVGLGAHGGSLYVGELTGQVFRVTP
jgi:glucose/arabinose dehydrogenase